jgi:dinuclear metal center YbgI/SA1388 family protein
MLVQEIIDLIEDFAPPALQENYDNSGLQVGDPDEKVKGVLLCLDVTHEVIKEAQKKKCNLIIAHHPLIFSPLKRITGKTYVEQILLTAIRKNIAIYACHTNADNVMAGVNKKVAEKLGLTNTKILQPKKGILKKLVTFCPTDHAEKVRHALFKAGCGRIGNYDSCSYNLQGEGTFRGNEHSNPFAGEKNKLHTEQEVRIETVFESYKESKVVKALHKAHPYEVVAYDIYALDNRHPEIGSGLIGNLPKAMKEEDFLQQVKSVFNVGCIRYTALTGDKVHKVALCGGSGSFLLPDAIRSGAQIFITGDFKYHQFFDAENKLVIADIGHYESEQFTPEIFYEVIRKKLPKFAVHLSKTNTNPINYL